MKKVVFLAAMLVFAVTAATAQVPEEVQTTVDRMNYEAVMARNNRNYKAAENCMLQTLRIVEMQPNQSDYREIKASLWYDLTRYYSLQKKKEEAVTAFSNALSNGWNNYEFATKDHDLDAIRNDGRFKVMMEGLRTNGHSLTAR